MTCKYLSCLVSTSPSVRWPCVKDLGYWSVCGYPAKPCGPLCLLSMAGLVVSARQMITDAFQISQTGPLLQLFLLSKSKVDQPASRRPGDRQILASGLRSIRDRRQNTTQYRSQRLPLARIRECMGIDPTAPGRRQRRPERT